MTKDKMKKIWKEHKKEIICGTVGAAVAGTMAYKFGIKKGSKDYLPLGKKGNELVKNLFDDVSNSDNLLTYTCKCTDGAGIPITDFPQITKEIVDSLGIDPDLKIKRIVLTD